MLKIKISICISLCLLLSSFSCIGQNDDAINEVQQLMKEAKALAEKNDPQSVQQWKTALELSEKFDLDTLSIQVIFDLGTYYYHKKRYKSFYELIENHLKDAEHYISKINFFLNLQIILRSVYMNDMHFDKALETALNIKATAIKYNPNFVGCDAVIAEVYLNSDQAEKAIPYALLGIDEGIKDQKKRGTSFVVAQSMAILYNSYYQIGQFKEASEYYEEYLQLMELDSQSAEFRAFHFLNAFRSIRDEDDFEKLLELYNSIEDANYLTLRTKSDIALTLAEKYNHNEDYKNAIKFWKTADDPELEKLNSIYTCDQIQKSYIKLGEVDSALYYNNKFKKLLYASQEEQTSKNMDELTIKYETAQKDAEISKKKVQMSRLIGGTGFIILLSTFLLFKYYNQKKIADQEIILLKKDQKLLAIDYMVQGQEEERKRIAQELHDGLGGLLTTAKLQMNNIQKEIDRMSQMNLLSKAEELVGNAYSEVRRISHDMMPGALVDLGLFAAVEDMADDINENHSTKVITHWYMNEEKINDRKKVVLYRIIQEAVQNAIKHADASTITIEITENKKNLQLTLEDDGKGFDIKNADNHKGIGMKSMRSRVEYLNGELNLTSSIGKGTSLDVLIPLI